MNLSTALNDEQTKGSNIIPIKPDYSGNFKFIFNKSPTSVVWNVYGNRLIIEPEENLNKMTNTDKAALFEKLLRQYRQRSVHYQGVKSAVILVTISGYMFIATNSQEQHEYHKDCSEINAVNAMIQAIGKSHPDEKIEEIHLRLGTQKDINITPKAYCPCGKCTDLLATKVTQNATLVTYPAFEEEKPLDIVEASNISEVQPGQTWRTPFSALNIDRKITLSEDEAKLGKHASDKLTNGKQWVDSFTPSNKIDNAPKKYRKYLNRLLNQTSEHNKIHFLERHPDIASINSFMVDKIAQSYQARSDNGGGQRNVAKIRCVVIRLEDGSMHYAIEAEGPEENALPYAEVTVIAKEQEKKQKVTDMWVMEYEPENIAHGKMATSPKEALERICKRRPVTETTDVKGNKIKDTVNVSYIPFNDGRLNGHALSRIIREYKIEEIYPNHFYGVKDTTVYGNGQNTPPSRTLH